MKILVIGAAGMLGSKLIQKLARDEKLNGQTIQSVIRHDVSLAPPPPQSTFAISTLMGDISNPAEADELIKHRPDVIFHLAAIVSGEAETNFDKGYAINLDGTRNLLEAVRRLGGEYKPKFIFTSSIAVFGAPFPTEIDDELFTAPLTSYGTQKAIGELLVNDYSRKGFIDGVSMRMPTVCVRPGKPNLAASGFFSNIIREPLVGQTANLPVADTVRHWFVSPRTAVKFLTDAAEMDSSKLGNRRTLNMPGISCTVSEQIEALRVVAGQKAVDLITRNPDALVQKIVAGWPENFTATRAKSLGFTSDKSFSDIIRVHIDDELGGSI